MLKIMLKKKKEQVVYPLRINKSIYKKLQNIGFKKERSISYIINSILEEYLKK